MLRVPATVPARSADILVGYAVHEAGHVVLAHRYGVAVESVVATTEGGLTTYRNFFGMVGANDPTKLFHQAVITAAGPEAQKIAGYAYDPTTEHPGSGDSHTIRLTLDRLAALIPSEQIPDPHQWAADLLAEPGTWAGVCTLAKALIHANGRPLTGSQAAAAVGAGRFSFDLREAVAEHGHAETLSLVLGGAF